MLPAITRCYANSVSVTMLLKLSHEIRECYRNAEEARLRAAAAQDARIRQDFLDMEKRWMFLARSYEFSEQLTRFTRSRSNRTPKNS